MLLWYSAVLCLSFSCPVFSVNPPWKASQYWQQLNVTKPKPCFICLIQYPTTRPGGNGSSLLNSNIKWRLLGPARNQIPLITFDCILSTSQHYAHSFYDSLIASLTSLSIPLCPNKRTFPNTEIAGRYYAQHVPRPARQTRSVRAVSYTHLTLPTNREV